jgi:hypothetical protein
VPAWPGHFDIEVDCVAALWRTPSRHPGRLKGYESDAVHRQIEATGAAPNILPKVDRRWKPCFSPVPYHGCNVIERMIERLKNFRRIATR